MQATSLRFVSLDDHDLAPLLRRTRLQLSLERRESRSCLFPSSGLAFPARLVGSFSPSRAATPQSEGRGTATRSLISSKPFELFEQNPEKILREDLGEEVSLGVVEWWRYGGEAVVFS